MFNHQNICAHVHDESMRRAVSQTFSPATSWFACLQKSTCARSLKYHPFATMPWSRGSVPVRNVDCAVQVTAGTTARIGDDDPPPDNSFR